MSDINYVERALEHSGVKGMKWGVRKDRGHEGEKAKTKTIAKLDKQFDKSLSGVAGFVKVNNAVAARINPRLDVMNAKPEYQGDMTQNPKIHKKYIDEYRSNLEMTLNEVSEAIGSNASGTQRLHVRMVGEGLDTSYEAFTEAIQHDAMDERLVIIPDFDSNGQIIGQTVKPKTLEHSGVKGMKWGVRKDAPRGAIKRGLTKTNVATTAGASAIEKGEKSLIFLPTKNRRDAAGRTQVRVLGVAKALNKDPQFKGKDLKTNPDLKNKYYNEIEKRALKIHAEELNVSRDDAWREVLSTTKSDNNVTVRVLKDRIKHADSDPYITILELNLELDELGQVSDIKATVPGDTLEHSGVKGMKWGVRKDDSASKTLTKSSGPESTSERYDRLLGQAKKEGANTFSDEELQFVTKRGNAISQVNRLNERKPGWAADIAKQVINQTAKKTLASVSDNASKKYITDPLASKSDS